MEGVNLCGVLFLNNLIYKQLLIVLELEVNERYMLGEQLERCKYLFSRFLVNISVAFIRFKV